MESAVSASVTPHPYAWSVRQMLGYVVEADLDLVLVLDAWTGGPLTPYLAQRVGVTLVSPLTAGRSTLRCAGTRETDVEISWPGGALLIENKIDAEFTKDQPRSYKVEVDARCAGMETVRSILVCPERRRPRLEAEAGGAFSVIVSCEDLAGVAEAAGPASAGAAIVLRAAAEAKPIRPVTPVDQIRSDWGDGYRQVFAEVAPPEAGVRPGPGSLRTATAEWMYFQYDDVDTAAVWSLTHWIPGGLLRMELMILDEPSGVPEGAILVRKPVQFWVEMPVPALTFERPAADQREQVAAAAQAAETLRRWAVAAGLRPRCSDHRRC